MLSLFSDGGCLGPNPSPRGGTWAALAVNEKDKVAWEMSGCVRPAELGLATFSNNIGELLGAVHALEAMPAKWSGRLFTDSQVTLYRIVNPRPKNMLGVPESLYRRVLAVKANLGPIDVILLGGHPTEEELAAGFKRKNKLPVSRHNVRCDELCNLAKNDLMALIEAEGAK